jgi:hypothetical protein
MSVEITEELGLTQLKPTSLVLKMADQSHENPMGILSVVHIIIAIIEYKIDYCRNPSLGLRPRQRGCKVRA